MKRCILIICIFLAGCHQNADQSANKASEAKAISDEQLIAYGNKLSAKAQKLLMKHVSSALAEGGPEKAIHYCSLSATGLLDTISEESGALIKRVALKTRNPKNRLKDKRDSTVYQQYQIKLNAAQKLEPRIFREAGEVYFYQPILMQISTCMKCHGSTINEIAPATLAAIAKRYPDDQAVNFERGDLRGLWKISFPRSSVRNALPLGGSN